MNFKSLTDDQLHETNIDLAEKQRRITLDQLNHLNETESRRLYSKFKCSSLFAYCVQELKMDDGTAGRYTSAARLLVELPEVEERIVKGTTQMTSVAQAGVFFRKEKKQGQVFDLEEKRSILEKLDTKSTREVDRILISESSNPEIHLREKFTLKSETITEAILQFDHETIDDLNRLKKIYSHAMPHAKFSDLIKRAVRNEVLREDPLEKAKRSEVRAAKTKARNATEETEPTPAPELKLDTQTARKAKLSVAAPGCEAKSAVKRYVWLRDKGECTFVDPRTGECCGSKHFVEEDHIIPKAMGGEYTQENIRLRCRAHNQRHAINSYGADKMSHFIN